MDKNKLFVGKLPWSITSASLKTLFSEFGEVKDTVVINDRDTGQSKGFGFVTFTNETDTKKALEMNGRTIEGRTIVVNIAKPREDREKGGFGGSRFGGQKNRYKVYENK